MDFDDMDNSEVLTTLQELFQTERAFYNTFRLLDVNSRDLLMRLNFNRSNTVLSFLREYMRTANRPRPEPERIVMRIPITGMDLSGTNFWEPIVIRPTVEQLRVATQPDVPVTDAMCPICQESVAVATRIRACGHCFHAACINEWFSQNTRCPVCRHDVREPAAGERPDWSFYVNDQANANQEQ